MLSLRILIAATFVATRLSAELLYQTQFEGFTTGNNNWSGTENWLTNDNTSGASFISCDAFSPPDAPPCSSPLGQTAGLGGIEPNTRRVSVLRRFQHDPIATGLPLIEIRTLVSIKDSTLPNINRDDFYLTLYGAPVDSTLPVLARLRFDNQSIEDLDSQFGIWREDGVRQFDTVTVFEHEQLYEIILQINLIDNKWSAYLSPTQDIFIELFADEEFTATMPDGGLFFDSFGYEWRLTSEQLAEHGNNFLLVGDLTVEAFPQLPIPIIMIADQGTLTWRAQAGLVYQVQQSVDLITWTDELPNSLFTPDQDEQLSYAAPTQDEARFFRVLVSSP